MKRGILLAAAMMVSAITSAPVLANGPDNVLAEEDFSQYMVRCYDSDFNEIYSAVVYGIELGLEAWSCSNIGGAFLRVSLPPI